MQDLNITASFGTNHHQHQHHRHHQHRRICKKKAILASYNSYGEPSAAMLSLDLTFLHCVMCFVTLWYKPHVFWMDIIQAPYLLSWYRHIVIWWSSSPSQIHMERLQQRQWVLTPMDPLRHLPAASTPGDQVNTHHHQWHYHHDHHHQQQNRNSDHYHPQAASSPGDQVNTHHHQHHNHHHNVNLHHSRHRQRCYLEVNCFVKLRNWAAYVMSKRLISSFKPYLMHVFSRQW